jgi:hypothetical protein
MTPNPGSPEAVALSCSCPVLDNHYGAGVDGQWWYSEDCPVHCGADAEQQREEGDDE